MLNKIIIIPKWLTFAVRFEVNYHLGSWCLILTLESAGTESWGCTKMSVLRHSVVNNRVVGNGFSTCTKADVVCLATVTISTLLIIPAGVALKLR